ncbi:MAG TPA: TlpA disulfide reductase family protein [Burkholderiales bacterium]|nr:TlpA disulfide reductase family protein [Burkholderiales bacterium]
MRSRRAWLRAAAALGLAAAGFPPAARADDLQLGAPAPPLVLQTLDGRRIATRELRGSVVIVTFWATWCEPCREELPLLSAYAARHAQQGLRVLGFSLDGPQALPQVRKVGATLSFPVGLLGSAWAGAYGRIWHIPVSFVIDRGGILRYDGWQAKDPVWSEASLAQVVDPLLRR